MKEVLTIAFEALKKGMSLEFSSDAGKVNWQATLLMAVLSVAYLICQTQIAQTTAQYLHKEYPILSFKIALFPTIIAAILCFTLMFIFALIEVLAKRKKYKK